MTLHPAGRILITREELGSRVTEIGRAISTDYAGMDPVLVGVLKGAVVFLADLMRSIELPLTTDFISVSSYGGSTRSSGIVKITGDLSISIEDRHVLIVEDIIDSGRTVSYLKRNLMTRHPRSLKICALLDKVERREVDVELDYVGFAIPDVFVVGYGLDHAGLYRNLSYLAALEPAPNSP